MFFLKYVKIYFWKWKIMLMKLGQPIVLHMQFWSFSLLFQHSLYICPSKLGCLSFSLNYLMRSRFLWVRPKRFHIVQYFQIKILFQKVILYSQPNHSILCCHHLMLFSFLLLIGNDFYLNFSQINLIPHSLNLFYF